MDTTYTKGNYNVVNEENQLVIGPVSLDYAKQYLASYYSNCVKVAGMRGFTVDEYVTLSEDGLAVITHKSYFYDAEWSYEDKQQPREYSAAGSLSIVEVGAKIKLTKQMVKGHLRIEATRFPTEKEQEKFCEVLFNSFEVLDITKEEAISYLKEVTAWVVNAKQTGAKGVGLIYPEKL
jgi:hypothetical protein